MQTDRNRVLMIYPAFNASSFWNYKATCALAGARHPAAPLGLITVAALLPATWEVRLVDLNAGELDEQDIDWADLVMTGPMHGRPQFRDQPSAPRNPRRLQGGPRNRLRARRVLWSCPARRASARLHQSSAGISDIDGVAGTEIILAPALSHDDGEGRCAARVLEDAGRLPHA